MLTRWKTGLSGLSTGERFRILEAEQKAKHLAVEFNCAERCVEHPIGLADCADISVEYCKVQWVRKRGRLLVQIFVWLTPDRRLFEAKWKLHPTEERPQPKAKG